MNELSLFQTVTSFIDIEETEKGDLNLLSIHAGLSS